MSDFLFPYFAPFEISQLRIYSRFWRDVIRPGDIWRCLEWKIRKMLDVQVRVDILIEDRVALPNVLKMATEFNLTLSGSAILSCFYGDFRYNDLDFYIHIDDYKKHRTELDKVYHHHAMDEYSDMVESLFYVGTNGIWEFPQMQLIVARLLVREFIIDIFDFDFCKNMYHCGDRKLYINSPQVLLTKRSNFKFTKIPYSGEIYHRIVKYRDRGFEFGFTFAEFIDFHRKFAFTAGKPTQMLLDYVAFQTKYANKSNNFYVCVNSPIIIYFDVKSDISSTREFVRLKNAAILKYCAENKLKLPDDKIKDMNELPHFVDEKIEEIFHTNSYIYYIKICRNPDDICYFANEFHRNLPIIGLKMIKPLLPMYQNIGGITPKFELAANEYGFDSGKKLTALFDIICIPRVE